jgi:hypothetical protein
MKEELSKWANILEKMDPLEDRNSASDIFQREAINIVSRWALKAPGKSNNTELMSWNTYDANLKRSGEKFCSQSNKATYFWLQDL